MVEWGRIEMEGVLAIACCLYVVFFFIEKKWVISTSYGLRDKKKGHREKP